MLAFEVIAKAEGANDDTNPLPVAGRAIGEISAGVTTDLEAVEAIWRSLQAGNIESPGQNFDFIRLWVQDRGIKRQDQRYLVGCVDGVPVALMALRRKRVYGVPIFTWFPGAHAGCYAPLARYDALLDLGTVGRSLLWKVMLAQLEGADAVYLRSMPSELGGHVGLLDELGTTLAVETLYRSEFSSWEECDRLQRSKSRRKHDRQQGDRLDAMGEVSFEVLSNSADTQCAIEIMFKQRSARFKVMGIRDPFLRERIVGFYHEMAKPDSGVDVRLHVLRLNGDIVAVRYNIAHGNRLFCLISSMSDDPAIQNGSPGKQCLLRVMQTVFDEGYRTFDMGSGFTDEKRHWCNVQTPLRQHYIGLTQSGMLIVRAHQAFQRLRARVKANKQLKSALRGIQQTMDRLTGAHKAAPDAGNEH